MLESSFWVISNVTLDSSGNIKMNLLIDQLGQLVELIHNQLVHNREKEFYRKEKRKT